MRAPPFSPQTDASGLSGSEAILKQLAAQSAFAAAAGFTRFSEMLNFQLAYAWEDFQDWCKANKQTNNMSMFTCAKLTLT